MAWVQRWFIRKLSKGNVSNHNSSASKLLSSYKVELSAADDDDHKEQIETLQIIHTSTMIPSSVKNHLCMFVYEPCALIQIRTAVIRRLR